MLTGKLRVAPNIPGRSREPRNYPFFVSRLCNDQRNINSARFVVIRDPVIALLNPLRRYWPGKRSQHATRKPTIKRQSQPDRKVRSQQVEPIAMMYIRALHTHIVENASKTWISNSIDHVVVDGRSICEFVLKPDAIFLQYRADHHRNRPRKLQVVLNCTPDRAPRDSFYPRPGSWLKQVFSGRASLLYSGDVLGDKHLDGPVCYRFSREDHPQRRAIGVCCSHQPQSSLIL